MIDIDIDIGMYHDIFIIQRQHQRNRQVRSQGPNNDLKCKPLVGFLYLKLFAIDKHPQKRIAKAGAF